MTRSAAAAPRPGPYSAEDRDWVHAAIAQLEDEARSAADTPLVQLSPTAYRGVELFFKDESTHATGSLKHRLARSLFMYALCNGGLGPRQGAIDASSGSTAISQAWFARRLDLPFTAVLPEGTAPGKLRVLRELDARCVMVRGGSDCRAIAHAIATREGLCFLDQFGLAEHASDWRNDNIAASALAQLARRGQPLPAWIVCGAGTGGTSATIGRHVRYRCLATRLCVAEPRGGAFARGWQARRRRGAVTAILPAADRPALIEGIGRRQVEPGFVFDVVDAVIEVDDVDSCAATWLLAENLGRRYGGSSGTNLVACLDLARRMHENGESGNILSVLCDRGERYAETLLDPAWLAGQGIDPRSALDGLRDQLSGDQGDRAKAGVDC